MDSLGVHGPFPGAAVVDGIVVRIEDDILVESEVRELENFQRLLNGRAMSRDDVIRELIDQWIIKNEANAAHFLRPSQPAVDTAFEKLVQQFPSPEIFHTRLAQAGITESVVRRLLEQQLYLSSFLDFKFRPAAQVTPDQMEAYYREELTPQLKSGGQAVVPLNDVEEQIRELLTQRAINQRTERWLEEARARLHIEEMPAGSTP
ncbi:MAG: hypothetical protein WBC04_04275 [Candidatus Acidiferrales bacterium]